MGLFDFGSKPPSRRVTLREYREHVIPYLKNVEFTERDLTTIETLALGNLEIGDKVREGIDEKECQAMCDWLKKERDKHSLSEKQIHQFSEIMNKYLEKSSSL